MQDLQPVHRQRCAPGPSQQLLAQCGARWPAVHKLTLQEPVPVSLQGCTLPPQLQMFIMQGTAVGPAGALTPLASVAGTLRSFAHISRAGVEASTRMCQELTAVLPCLLSLKSSNLRCFQYESESLPVPVLCRNLSAAAALFFSLSALRSLTILQLTDSNQCNMPSWPSWPRLMHDGTGSGQFMAGSLAGSLSHLTGLEMLGLSLPLTRSSAACLRRRCSSWCG